MQADLAGFDCLLVGDSVGMVVHGHDTTLPVTVSDMMTHCRAVSRGAQRPFLIGDLPFGSYETSPKQAIETSIQFMKEGNMDAIKLEGMVFKLLKQACNPPAGLSINRHAQMLFCCSVRPSHGLAEGKRHL